MPAKTKSQTSPHPFGPGCARCDQVGCRLFHRAYQRRRRIRTRRRRPTAASCVPLGSRGARLVPRRNGARRRRDPRRRNATHGAHASGGPALVAEPTGAPSRGAPTQAGASARGSHSRCSRNTTFAAGPTSRPAPRRRVTALVTARSGESLRGRARRRRRRTRFDAGRPFASDGGGGRNRVERAFSSSVQARRAGSPQGAARCRRSTSPDVAKAA